MAPAGSAYTAGMSVLAKVTSLPLHWSGAPRGAGPCRPNRAASDPNTTVRGQAGDVVHLGRDGDAVDEIGELDHAGHFRDHRVGMRIPIRDRLAGRDHIAVVDRDGCTVRDLVALALAADSSTTPNSPERDTATRCPFSWRTVLMLCRRIVPLLFTSTRWPPPLGGRAADVESAHRELRAGSRSTAPR